MFALSVVGIAIHSAMSEAAKLEITPPITLALEQKLEICPYFELEDGSNILVARNNTTHELWVNKMSAANQNLWKTLISAQNIDFLAKASDGGYWVVFPNFIKIQGVIFPQFQSESLKKISRDGTLQPQTEITLKVEGLKKVYTAIDVGNGLIVAGWKGVRYNYPSAFSSFEALVPWIAKLDFSGNILWQQTFSEDKDTLLTSIDMGPRIDYRSRIVASSSGEVYFAISAKTTEIYRDAGKVTVNETSHNYTYGRASFVFKLDKNGNELSRVKSPGPSWLPSLFESESGIVLIERYTKASFKPSEDVDMGIRYTKFDNSLNVVNRKEYPLGFYHDYVTKETNGGYFLTGFLQIGKEFSGRAGFISSDVTSLEIIPLPNAEERYWNFGLTSNNEHRHASAFWQNSEGKTFLYQIKLPK
jgi:hypothetical protein